ncbi:MAG: DUF4397 domain-containing protein [Rhizobacter sp.]|nr:DUF4397 domain-containing protein [Ferruginibacter sp.]
MQYLFKFIKLLAFAGAVMFLSSCDKSDDDIVSGTAKVTVTNASPDAPAVDVYVDNVKITDTQLGFATTTGMPGSPYLTVDAGTRNVRISANGTINVTQGNVPFSPNVTYSIFVFDTLSTTATLKGLVLADSLTAPAAGKSHIRFLHLSPDADTIDIDFAKVNDTTPLTDKRYYGRATNADPGLATFLPINAGVYTINIMKANTKTPVLATLQFTFAEGKIYTVYAAGLRAAAQGSPLALHSRVILHN